MHKNIENTWHSLDQDSLFRNVDSSERGLAEKQAKERLRVYGPNVLHSKSSSEVFFILLRQLHNPLVYVLLFSTALAIFLGKISDSFVILSVVILNTIIGFLQEYRAHKIISALSKMIPQKTSVLREGDIKLIDSSELVPGDVVVLQAGERIAADLRIFSVKNLECDESALTGESLPVQKNTAQMPKNVLVSDRRNMAFNGTYVTSGTGLGVVVATGCKTEFGKISELVEQVRVQETPMAITIKKIGQWITFVIILVSLFLLIVGYLRGSSFFDAAFAAITMTVAAIPEGLPAIVTIASAIGLRRMASRQAIIRQLPAVESLGSTSIICTDKTGTLTYNEMTVQKIWTPSGWTFLSGAGYSLEGQIEYKKDTNIKELDNILLAGILCSDATLDEAEGGLVPIGDPTEIALVVAGRKKGMIEEDMRKAWRRLDVLPFTSEKRFMASLNQSPEQERFIFIKGAPEEVIGTCSNVPNVDLTLASALSMAKEGMRVLAIARKQNKKTSSYIEEEYLKDGCEFLGFIGMVDPCRKEVYQAVRSCSEAGINVKMITGDHPLTAEAIARDLGILKQGAIISGHAMGSLDAEGWRKVALGNQVFARVSPEHKLKLVEALQSLGHVVAMTGDGVNDAAALKRADIGVAMGIKGTDVAKEAADMILADDNFASIEAAVEEGRRVYDNLIKSLAFILPTSCGQALVIFFAVLFFPIDQGVFLHPMSPIQILWINLIVGVFLSLPLAFEPAAQNVMKRPPRKKNEPIFSRYLLLKTFAVSLIMAMGTIGLFLWEYQREITENVIDVVAFSEAQTIAVTAMMLFQVFYLFSCRSLGGSKVGNSFFANRYIFIGIGIVFIAQIGFIYLPFMNKLFHSYPLDFKSIISSFMIVFLIIPFIVAERILKRDKTNSN